MTKQFNSEDGTVKYEDANRKIWKEGDFVYKTDPERLTLSWRSKMEKILENWDIPVFEGFIDNGYITKYISGTDLHGNSPFGMPALGNQGQVSILEDSRKAEIIPIFNSAMKVGEKLGFTLGDITCGNIMIGDGVLNLIDYEVITEYPLNTDYVEIWNNTLKIVFK